MAGKPQKNLAYSVLLDFYGPVLTDKQRVILTEYSLRRAASRLPSASFLKSSHAKITL